MPSTRHTSIVSNSDRNRLFSPTASTNSANWDAAPVSVSTPMITPTIAQAMPTATACRAPSIRLPRMMASVSRPPLATKFHATSIAIITMIGMMPYSKKLAVVTPSADPEDDAEERRVEARGRVRCRGSARR